MAKVLLHVIFVCLPLIVGCATKHSRLMESAQAHYQANAYETALKDAIAALKIKPDYQKAQDLAPTLFKAAAEGREDKIKEIESSSNKFKWDRIVAEYKELIKINAWVKNLPPLTHKKTKERIIFDTKDYTEQLSIVSEKAAETHYQEGIRLAALSDDAEAQKKAAKEFQKAEQFVSDYKDAHSRYEKAKRAATKRIVISFENKSGKEQYGDFANLITDQISRAILEDNSATEFLELVSRDELDLVIQEQKLGVSGLVDKDTAPEVGEILGVDEIFIGSITHIDHNAPDATETTRQVKRKVREQVEESYTDEKGRERTRTKWVEVPVTATITTFHRTAKAKVTISYTIVKVRTTKKDVTKTFYGSSEFEYQWGNHVEGDERALSADDKRLCAKSERHPPSASEMVKKALEEAVYDLSDALIEHVR